MNDDILNLIVHYIIPFKEKIHNDLREKVEFDGYFTYIKDEFMDYDDEEMPPLPFPISYGYMYDEPLFICNFIRNNDHVIPNPKRLRYSSGMNCKRGYKN